MEPENSSTLCLFDVDGTLTPARQKITLEMEEFLKQLQKKCHVGIVGGSDLNKINEQLSLSSVHVTERFEYVFSENGLVAHSDGKEIHRQNIGKYLGEEKSQRFINFALKTLSEITLPCKRGNFIEFRSGLINVCPVGRSCSQAEREEFSAYDKEHNLRVKLVEIFKKEFADIGLQFIIGGQISIDVFPSGWDKTYCLNHIKDRNFSEIHFFGDKTNPGGNDHEICHDSRTIGHTVTSPDDTYQQVRSLFF